MPERYPLGHPPFQSFCLTTTPLVVYEQFLELPGAVAAFAAAWWVIASPDQYDD